MGKKAPSGLAIKRSGGTFTCTWKKGGKYWTKQQFQYKLSSSRSWVSVSVGNSTTSKSFSVKFKNFYPYKGTKLTNVKFRVRGKKGSEHTKWVEKTLTLHAPKAPSITATLDSNLDNKTDFEWSAENPTTGDKVFAKTQYKTALMTDYESDEGAKAAYGSASQTGASGSYSSAEDNSVINDGNSHTRWVAVRSRGCAGDSGWVYANHVYAKPNQAFDVNASTNAEDGYLCMVDYQTNQTQARPIDQIEVQYSITRPSRGLECPSGSSWSTGSLVAYQSGSDKARFYIDDTISDDECLFVRVNTLHDHDTNENFGVATLADTGHLSKPSIVSVDPNSTHHTVTIEADNNSAIDDSFLAIVYQPSSDVERAYVAGILPHGYTVTTVTCPDWSGEDGYSIGVYAVVGTYERSTDAQGLPRYNVLPYQGKPLMVSETEWWVSGDVPSQPEHVTIAETGTVGKIRVSWVNPWSDATGTQLAWADSMDAWESTDEPDDYTIESPTATSWIITGLKTGQYYIRVRTFNGNAENTIYSPWSDFVPYIISSVPVTPVLSLDKDVITQDDSITASWVYTSLDGSSQTSAELYEIIDVLNRDDEYVPSTDTEVKSLTIYYTRTGSGTTQDPYVFTEVTDPSGSPAENSYYQKNLKAIKVTSTEQQVAVVAQDYGWESGETHYLTVKVTYGEGDGSTSWSPAVPIVIAPRLTCSISSTSLETITVPQDEDEGTTRQVLSLMDLPLQITVTGAGASNLTTVTVERSASYFAARPDESEFHGYEGETVILFSQAGETPMSFALEDLLTNFDDGASYRITAQVRDNYGQVASAEPIEFEVHWEHQALMPEGNATIDNVSHVAYITPIAPEGAIDSDVCDIYRLSADKPELLVENGVFGTTYVDPYPTIGATGGHRIVFKTASGDYITDSNEFAWIDLTEEDGDILNIDRTIIDFGGRQIMLNYNVDFQHAWAKDFLETKYLGGSVQGDWNPAVSRTATVSGLAITLTEQELINSMRRLAVYPDVCRIRTQDGSNIAADIQVTEARSHDNKRLMATFNLSVTRVDPQGTDGVPYNQFIEE